MAVVVLLPPCKLSIPFPPSFPWLYFTLVNLLIFFPQSNKLTLFTPMFCFYFLRLFLPPRLLVLFIFFTSLHCFRWVALVTSITFAFIFCLLYNYPFFQCRHFLMSSSGCIFFCLLCMILIVTPPDVINFNLYIFLFCYDFSYVNLLTMLSDHKFFLMYAFSMLTPDTIIHHLLLLLQYFVALINSLPFYSLYNRTHYGFNLLMLGCYYYTPLMLFLHCL